MTSREDALNALNDRDWTGADVDTGQPSNVTIVVSARLHADLAAELFAEAEARGVKPGVLVRDLVEQGLSAVKAASDEHVMVIDPAALQTEIQQAIRRSQRTGRAAA